MERLHQKLPTKALFSLAWQRYLGQSKPYRHPDYGSWGPGLLHIWNVVLMKCFFFPQTTLNNKNTLYTQFIWSTSSSLKIKNKQRNKQTQKTIKCKLVTMPLFFTSKSWARSTKYSCPILPRKGNHCRRASTQNGGCRRRSMAKRQGAVRASRSHR